MDDILLFYAENRKFDSDKFMRDFTASECYWQPLKLEDGKNDTFLETTFHIANDDECRYWLKNENEIGRPPKTGRYAHFHSFAPFATKRTVMMATLRKLQNLCSDDDILTSSAIQKLNEFIQLQYPPKLIWSICSAMAVITRNPTWFRIRASTIKNPASLYRGR